METFGKTGGTDFHETKCRELIRSQEQKAKAHSFQKEEILDIFIFRTKIKWLITLYCWYKHHWLIHLDPKRNIGHEIHGVFIKN